MYPNSTIGKVIVMDEELGEGVIIGPRTVLTSGLILMDIRKQRELKPLAADVKFLLTNKQF